MCVVELRRLPRAAAGSGSGVWRPLAIIRDVAVKPRRGKLQLWQSLGESFEVSAEAVNRRFAKTRPSTSNKQVDCDARYLVKPSFDILENFTKAPRKLCSEPGRTPGERWSGRFS